VNISLPKLRSEIFDDDDNNNNNNSHDTNFLKVGKMFLETTIDKQVPGFEYQQLEEMHFEVAEYY